MQIIILDGRSMTDRDTAHAYLAKTLHFPDWYGGNLDAMADCLSELDAHSHLILTNVEDMRLKLGEYGERMLTVFRELSAEPGSFHFAIDGE